MPDVLACRDFGHGASGADAGHAIVDQGVTIVRIGKFVGDLLEHPRFAAFAGARVEAKEDPLALHPLAFEREVEVPFLDRLVLILTRIGNPPARVPQHYGAAAIFARGNGSLEAAIIERVILNVHREPLFIGIETRPFGHRPALEDAVEFETKIPVQPPRGVLLNDEAVALAPDLAPARLLRLGEVALAVIGLDVERGAPGHGLSPLARRGLCRSFL